MLAGVAMATPTMLARQQRLLFDQSARCARDLARGLELPGIRATLGTSVTLLELLELLGIGKHEAYHTATTQIEAGRGMQPDLDPDPGEDSEL